jgi:hypothetical protein
MVLESNTLDVLFVKDGQQGEDGKILYTWIKYAKDASGTGITDNPNGAIYIGISYNNESSIESNDPTQYAWTKIQGADGKKGEDAYTIFLENENISFATDENRNPLSEQAYTSRITVMKGATPVTDFGIGDIAKTQGIAVAKTDTAIAISVVNGNPLPSDSGEIEIPITVGGTVFKKILTWTCAKKGDQGIQGPQGEKGEQGEKGKNGTSVTIINKSITYQLSTSGTTIPTGTWQTSPQTIPEGQYQWAKTSVAYSDGNKTESYSISYHGKNGSDGTSVKTTSTSVKYQVGDSGTTKPTGTWQSNVPTVAQGKYLWTQTIVNYSDGNSTESYSVSYRGIDGNNGANGMNVATIYLYQRATSTPSKPSNTLTYTFSTTKITGTLNNGWSTAIPTGTDAVYVTVASVSSKNDTATIATSVWSAPVVLAQNGKTGSDGKAGLNVATIYLYQRNTSKPSKPSASVTYTFSTGVASGLNNGWSQKIPDGTNPLYVTLATASSNTSTDTILSSEWSDVVVMAQNGEDGQDGISPKVSLSKSGDTTTISIVDATGTHTQTVKDGTNGTPGEDGKDGKTSYFHVKYSNDGGKTFTGNSGEDTGIYMGSYTDYTEADSTDVKKYNWVKVKGDKGDTGQKGQDGTSVKITSKSVTYQTSTSGTTAPTGTWSTTVPTVANGQYLWTKTTVQYSDSNKTEAYSVSYKGTNGTNGTSVTVSKTEVTYQVSTSGTTAPTGVWSTTMPSCNQGQYLWTKTYVKYSDGKETTSYSVSYKGVDGADGQDGNSFAWNMLSETNCGKKHWETASSGGKYSVEDFITEDNINAVKLICTEAVSSSEWSYTCFTDLEMLKQLKPSTKYTLSYDIKANRSGMISHTICRGNITNSCTNTVVVSNIIGDETWQHISVVLTTNDLKTTPTNEVVYLGRTALSKVGYSIIKNLKLAEGDIDTPWSPSQSDIEGKGVAEIVQYYLATSQASGVTSSTSGWSTDITTQKLTADKKYLWNCYQTKYSDGTSEPISTPKVIGVYGDKGNGIVASVQRPNKTESWWSQVGAVGHKDTFDDSSNTRNNCRVGDIFTVMGTSTEGNSHTAYYKSTTDSGDLAGECINHVVAESGADAKNLSITPSSQYFKSTDGGKTFAPNTIKIKPTIQGEISFGKWQYSIDGGVSFADVVSGQKGLTISNNVLTVSKDSSLYGDAVTMITFRAVASDSSFYDTCSIAKIYDVTDIQIGGVNLIKNSNFADGINKWVYMNITCAVETDSTYGHHIKFSSSVGGDVNHRLFADIGSNFNHVKDTTYTLSFYAKASANIQVQTNVACATNTNNYSLTTSWQRFTFTYQASAAGSLTFWAVEANKDIYLANIKLERGNKATDYTVSPEDVQTAILSTKNSIENVSSKVDTNTKSIQDKVSKTTYERELTLVKGDLSKANEGLNKWRYEIYPKSLFESADQGKSTIDIFARNLNLVPSRTVLLDDASLSTGMNYGDNHIAYALTFVKMSATKDVTTKMYNDDGASFYVNGKLIGSYGGNYTTGNDISFTLAQGWNCIEVVVNEEGGLEGFRFSTTLSKLSECQMMNCYYGTPVARQSRITNQLVDVTKNLTGVTSTVQDVMTAVGNSGNITEFKNNYSKWKQSVDKIEQRVGEKYVTNEKFDGLEIGGRNLLRDTSDMKSWAKGGKLTITYDQLDIKNNTNAIKVVNSKSTAGNAYLEPPNRGPLSSGKYTVSFYAKTDSTSGADVSVLLTDAYTKTFKINNIWTQYIITFDVANDIPVTNNFFWFNFFGTTEPIYFCYVKLEKGNKATDWTPAPEDINGRITSVETIATQTADKFSWLVKSGTNSSNFELTDKTATLVASKINQYGLVTFNGLDDTTKDKINTITSGNLITVTPANPKSDYGGGQTYNVIADDKGGRCVQWNSSCASFLLLNSYTPVNFTSSDQLYYDIRVPNWSSTTFDTKLTIWFYNKNKTLITSATKTLTLKSTIWNHFTGYLTLPSSSNWGDLYYYIIGLTNPNKQAIGITNDSYIERVNSYATTYAKNAVDWVGQNGTNTNNMYSMISKWTDGAVSDTTQMNGGWIKTNTITANKIAIGDFTNYADINESNTYWFLVEQTKEGTWFYRDGSALQRDNVISELHTCQGGEKFYVEYDISNTIKEGDEYKYAGLMIFGYDGNGGIVSYNRNAGVTATANGEITHITTQLTMPDTTRSFRVYLQIEGHTPFTGTLKIRNISVRKAVTGNLIVDGSITADKIATDAIKSRNYISSGGTQGSFLNLSDGSFTSPNLSWDSNGNLIAKNANLSGQITATKGKIGSFNLDKSLYLSNNSPYYFSQFCAKKVYGLTNEGDIYIGSEGIYSYSWETGNMYIGDSESIQADVSSSRGVCIENGEIYIYKSDYCKDYPTACDNKYGLVLAGGYVASANYSDGGSIDGFNFILSPNKFNINGTIYASNELQTGGDQIRIISGNIGCMVRNDSADFYILRTNSGDPYGGWTNDRPFRINWASNDITCGHNLTANDLIANSWVYCSEVHSSGAVVIASNSESYYWAHGYQMARGTSWGGVCIGDDSQGLRLYGTSIWASHSISTSDENLKENFTTLDQYEDFYMNLNPIGFNYIGDYDGKKTHFGFGAHKTEDILESEGYDSDKFAVVTHRPLVQEDIEKRFGKDVEVDIETEYGVSYTEFIALNTHMIQKTRKELEQVKQEKTDLEARLQAIEAKLGL